MANSQHQAVVTVASASIDPMVKFVVEEFERYERFHTDRFNKAIEIYNQWCNKPTVRDFNWQNSVHVPMTFEAEQTITPRIFAALFPNDAPVDLITEGDASEEQGIVINRTVKVRGISNPYNHQRPPFCKFTLFKDAKPCWFGVGQGEVGKPTQDRINKIVNQRLDNVDLVLNKQGFYNGNDVLINTKKLQVSKPGQWHKVSDTVTSIRWMDTPDVTASSYKEEELAKSDYRESTGATVPLMPTDQGQHRTASGINLLQGAAGMRFRPVLRKMEIDFIQDLATMYLSNLQQFMAVPEWIRVTSDNGKVEPIMVKPEQIQARVFFIPTGISEILNKEVQIGQLLRFKEVTANDPTINRAEINKRIAELMSFKDIYKIMVPQQQAKTGAGALDSGMQERINQRLSEGASIEQIKQEILGNPPVNEEVA